MAFPEKLVDLRKKAGMTQSDLAEKLNVSRQAISRWEQGTAMPEVDTLVAICDLFDVSLDYLVRDKNCQEKAEPEESLPEVPSYWSFLPKLWWAPGLLAVLCRICPYVTQLLLIVNSPAWSGFSDFLNGHKFLWIFFSPPVAYTFSAIFAAITALIFLWALVKYWKARN